MTAAQDAAGQQHYPQGALYMVATPIGNLADIGLRALHVLGLVDTVACEDTRHTAGLLQAFGLHKPLLPVHEHNEAQAAQTVLARLREGQRVAYVSDAGTPGVSDPGARLVAAAMEAGLRCIPVPGPSSLTSLLSVTGQAGWDGHFVFQGFLSPKAMERQRGVAGIAASPMATLLLEAPHRIEALARDLALLGERKVTIGRELTKQFEEVACVPASGLSQWLAQDTHRTRGEFALLIHPLTTPADEAADAIDAGTQRTLDLLLAELPVKTAVKLCAEITGAPRNAVYAAALARKQQD